MNHLSNTLLTLSDNKIGADTGTDKLADFYEARVLSATDYYAFGMSMKGRSWQSERYRYGFNGKENDGDIGEEQDYGNRIYCPECGVFLSVDPIAREYPELSPYQFASRSPIGAVDLDGLEADKDFNAPNFSVSKMWGDLWKNFTWSPANASNQQELQRGSEKQKYAAQQVENATFIINETNEGMTTVMTGYFSFLPAARVGMPAARVGFTKLLNPLIKNVKGEALPFIEKFDLGRSIANLGVETTSQLMVGEGDIKSLDMTDIAFKTARLHPILDVTLGTMFDFRPLLNVGSKFKTVLDKSATEISADLVTKTVSSHIGRSVVDIRVCFEIFCCFFVNMVFCIIL